MAVTKPGTKVFTLDGSNKRHPTNVLGRASTTLPRLALARYECDRSLLFCLGGYISDPGLGTNEYIGSKLFFDQLYCVGYY